MKNVKTNFSLIVIGFNGYFSCKLQKKSFHKMKAFKYLNFKDYEVGNVDALALANIFS